MRESGNLPDELELEQRASVYKITPYKSSQKELLSAYNNGKWLRWSLNKDNFNIKIWKENEFHEEVDREGFSDGTTGNISKNRGITYSDSRVFNDKRKAEVSFAIKKYLTASS